MVVLILLSTRAKAMSRMLERDEHRLERLTRINIEGGLPPSATLLSDLTKFLNQTKKPTGKRIVAILEKMLELEQMTNPIRPEEPMIAAVEWERTDPKKYQLHWEIAKRELALRRELSKYHFSPRAEIAMGGGGQGPSVWAVWWKGDVGSRWEGHLRMTASEALELILKLTQVGDLTRLRRCTQCRNWLFARFRHQTFCSTKCQQKNFTQTEEWKKHRRRYMRNYYRLLKQYPHLKRKRNVRK
jgi:hypothetical protein